MRRQGRIEEWNDERGFGFVRWHGGDERAFAHISDFEQRGTRPAVGAVVTYDVVTERGRPKAISIRYAGMSAPSRTRQHPQPSTRLGTVLGGLATIVVLAAIATTAWRYWLKARPPTPAAVSTQVAPARAVPGTRASFSCTSGKTHCSHMASCAEAKYYINHCPGTKMDGDGDGEPCESMCPGSSQ